MRIEIDRLEELGGHFSEVCSAADLSLEGSGARLAGSAQVQGRIERNGQEIDLVGELMAQVDLACDRCLKTIRFPIQASFEAGFVPAVDWRASPEHELREDDLKLSTFDGETIDLTELAREEILLAIPGHVLCSETCKGLCPVCGGDLNQVDCKCTERQVDPRWAALKDVRF
jgi:uncharacterized protein